MLQEEGSTGVGSWAGEGERQKGVERLATVTTWVRGHCCHQSGRGENGGQRLSTNGIAKEGEMKKQGKRSRYQEEVGECGLKVPKGHPKDSHRHPSGVMGLRKVATVESHHHRE